MAINRRMRQNPTPQTPCYAMCEHLQDSSGFCTSGMYDCGSGPGGNCNCTNMGPVPWGNAYWTAPDSGLPMCSFSCNQFNQNNDYYSCMAGCGRMGRSPGTGGRSGGTERGATNFRTGGSMMRNGCAPGEYCHGGEMNQYGHGGGINEGSPNSCMDGMGNSIPCYAYGGTVSSTNSCPVGHHMMPNGSCMSDNDSSMGGYQSGGNIPDLGGETRESARCYSSSQCGNQETCRNGWCQRINPHRMGRGRAGFGRFSRGRPGGTGRY